MKTTRLVALAATTALALVCAGEIVQPAWTNMTRIRGDQPMMTNFKEWAESAQEEIGGKQPLLPFPTNAIPADVVADTPWIETEADPTVTLVGRTLTVRGDGIAIPDGKEVNTNGVDALIVEYDRTNLTERIAAKQDEIADLAEIREGAARGATAVQNEIDPTVPDWAKSDKPPQTMPTNAVEAIANRAVETNAVTVVTTNAVARHGESIAALEAATNAIPQGAARPLPRYLHALDFADSYPNDAAWYHSQSAASDAQCSARRDGNALERNYDWRFDDAAEFVVRMVAGKDRFASVGVANVGTNLTETFVNSGKWSRYYKALPGHTVDGINENGVVAEVNVVGGMWPRTTGEIHALGAVRWALDHATSAAMAASNLAAKVYVPADYGENFHWMLADERETWIVENGEAHQVANGPAAMTNFRLYPNRDTTGEGQERYDALMGGASITSQWWTLTYTPSGYRPSDLPGIDAEGLAALWNYWGNNPRESHRGETFGGESWWQTVHTSVYDISNRTVRIAVQEAPDWYTFAVPSAGGVDEEAVRGIVEPMIDTATNAALSRAWGYTDSVSDELKNLMSIGFYGAIENANTYTDTKVKPLSDEILGLRYYVDDIDNRVYKLESDLPAVSQAATNYTDVAMNVTLAAANVYTDTATNATLAAANAYTDAHAGTGGLSTNAVLALIEDSVGGTNAVRAAVAHTAVGPTWMRPNAWRLTASPTRDVAEIAAIYYSTNNYRTYSNEVARVITTRSAQLRGERLDRYAIDPLIVTNFAAVTPGCSVDELGYVTAEADGQYRVAGTDSTGETRYCDIWFSAGIRDTIINSIYVGDLAPHLAAANDAALDVLANAALVGTYTVAGKTCNQYSTIAPTFAKSGAHGYYNPWAVSPHVLMTAGHMGYLGNRGPISYGGHTVNRVRAVWLKDWALTNGFTEAEVNAVSMIGDIEMIVCDNSGALPAEILPTFISPAAFAARFPGGIRGALLWSANQHHADMVPRVAMNDHGYYLYGDADFAAYPARADLAGRLAEMGQQHIFHGGDSGHVVFLRDDQYDIPITQYYSASTGPDLIAAFPMIKAFVENLGDTLKEVE